MLLAKSAGLQDESQLSPEAIQGYPWGRSSPSALMCLAANSANPGTRLTGKCQGGSARNEPVRASVLVGGVFRRAIRPISLWMMRE
jgi:hypothetical protein